MQLNLYVTSYSHAAPIMSTNTKVNTDLSAIIMGFFTLICVQCPYNSLLSHITLNMFMCNNNNNNYQ